MSGGSGSHPGRSVAPKMEEEASALKRSGGRGSQLVDGGAVGAERIAAAFARATREGRPNGETLAALASPIRPALMPYLMGGYPTLADSVRIGEAYVESGADIIELGVPYTDPLADGPVIHAAATRALAAGANLGGVLEVARALAPSVPVVVMCYANMVLAGGGGSPGAAFVERLARSGASGLIVPDLPFEEAAEVLDVCDAHGVALVPLVAPTTPPDRLARIGARARGFLYTVSVVGTTGEREALAETGMRAEGECLPASAERFVEIVARAKAATEVPVALGFGISTPEQARQAAEAGADGVIVGSRLVRAAGESADPAAAVGALVAELATGLARR